MIRTISWVGALVVAALGAAACGDDDIPGMSMDNGGGGGSAGSSSGAGGSRAGAGGSSAGTGGAGAGGSGAGTGGSGAGTGGGAPDAGALDAGLGSDAAVDAGTCTDPSCVCAVDVITGLPYSQQWQTTGESEADVVDIEGCQVCDNTADHIVTFTAPATATYRFLASSGGDVELAVYPGDCTAQPNDVSCGEDIDAENEDYNDRVDVDIAQGETVTVVVGESCEENGGTGTLTIEVAP
ncbi:MAG TPA: hypothetical protein VMG12_00325 [Polyangiaceae bacterium]|nr:hypothetical protein [Polyangiaceae bacterium]